MEVSHNTHIKMGNDAEEEEEEEDIKPMYLISDIPKRLNLCFVMSYRDMCL